MSVRLIPDDDWDKKDLARLNAVEWQINLLRLNPEYPHWGPYEDYMSTKGEGWNSPVFYNSWKDFNFQLDELNELVNFYFEIDREHEECSDCCGDGIYNDAKIISESFYDFSSPFRREYIADNEYFISYLINKYGDRVKDFCDQMRKDIYWHDKITQDELDILIEKNRIKDGVYLDEVNFANKEHKNFHLNHDAINRGILIQCKCNKFGIPYTCDTCDGYGYVYTAENAHVNLVLWIIHPRKGASRGVEVKNIQQENIPDILEYLKSAANRNALRFKNIM